MLDKVRKTITENNLIETGDNILVGVSGGADSVCLLHILDYFSCEMGIKIHAVHINHMLRGEEADMDEEYVKKLCETMKIKLFSISINIKELAEKDNISIEEAARNARYKEFKFIAHKLGNCKIAVAHNKNDQAETVIMNLIRGTGLNGLKGIDYIRDNIIRPLLDVDRRQIEEYCRQNNLEMRTDSTNLQNIYTRNKVRLEVIPFINDNFKINIVENIARMADLVRDDLCYMKIIADEMYNRCLLNPKKEDEDESCTNAIYLDIDKLKGAHKAILRRVLRMAIQNLKGDIKNIESIHISKVSELCLDGRTGAEIHLPSNVRVSKTYNVLKVYLIDDVSNINKDSDFKKVSVTIPGITQIESLNIKLEGTILNKETFNIEKFRNMGYNSLIQFFDYEKINEGAEVTLRNREKGDLIKPLKSNGTKKLKEYMIDNKIPREKRDKILLLAKNNEIIWIIGYRISDKFKVTENTKSILKYEVKV